ncbi:hypothetical protein ACHAWF_018576 [Thalassiosira exigua]
MAAMRSIGWLALLVHLWSMPPVAISDDGRIRGAGGGGYDRELVNLSNVGGNGTDAHRQAARVSHVRRSPTTRRERMESRIIGGSAVKAGRYSYTVALLDDNGLFCGGVLISLDMVLTAAHCADSKDSLDFFVGSEVLSDRFSNRQGEVLALGKKWQHKKFDWTTMKYDFAVIQLKKKVSVDVEVVTLNKDPGVPSREGNRVVALGWGDTDASPDTYKQSNKLHGVTVDYIPNNKCAQRSGYVGNELVSYQGQVSHLMVRTQFEYTFVRSCQIYITLFSGGPLVIPGSDKRGRKDVLVGLSSWGYACAHESLPGVYARVSSQYEWIKSIVCKNSKYPDSSFGCGRHGNSGGNGNTKPDTDQDKDKDKEGNKKKKKKKKKKKNKNSSNKRPSNQLEKKAKQKTEQQRQRRIRSGKLFGRT